MRKKGRLILAVVFILYLPSVCLGAELFEGVWRAVKIDPEQIEGLVAGAGVLYSTTPYIGKDDSVWGVPLIVGKYKRFYSDGSSVGYLLNDNKELIFSAILAPRFMGYDSDDSDDLAGMEDRDWTIDGGLRATWSNKYFLLNVSGVSDLANKHQGQEAKAVISREFFDGFITPRAGVKWESSDLIDYYYGVKSTETRSNRSEYEGKSTVNYLVGFALGIPLGDAWAVTGDFEYEGLGSKIKDSPIVDRDDIYTTVVGLVYRF